MNDDVHLGSVLVLDRDLRPMSSYLEPLLNPFEMEELCL